MITIKLPKKVEERLREESWKTGLTEEELVLKALFNSLSLDPELRVEAHLALSEKHLGDAEEFLRKGDYVQASEKAWGAASQIVKAMAAKRGLELRSHRELHKFIVDLRRESGDVELSTLWSSATSLHQNFYENWLPPEMVRDLIENVKRFVEKVKKLK